jgi:maleylacetate reductase
MKERCAVQTGIYTFPRMERVIYGQPAAETLAAEVERIGASRVFLLASRSLTCATSAVADVREALGRKCVAVYDRMPAHTPRDAVVEAAAVARDADSDLVVTFGGGSLTDAGKIIRICLRHDVRDVSGLEPFRLVTNADGSQHTPRYEGPDVQQISIPTTLSGGEFSAGASCTDTRNSVKHAWSHPQLMARIVILDPAPTIHTPEALWLSTGIRAVDHCVEGICSVRSNMFCDAAFLHALRLLKRALPRVISDPDDLQARLDCQCGAWLSMVGVSAGVPMGASHAIGHVLGGTCDVPHGFTSCVMLPAVLRWNAGVNGSRQELVSEALGQPGKAAADVVDAMITDLGLPRSLSAVGVRREDFDRIARGAMHDRWTHTNPRKIDSPAQVLELLSAAA